MHAPKPIRRLYHEGGVSLAAWEREARRAKDAQEEISGSEHEDLQTRGRRSRTGRHTGSSQHREHDGAKGAPAHLRGQIGLAPQFTSAERVLPGLQNADGALAPGYAPPHRSSYQRHGAQEVYHARAHVHDQTPGSCDINSLPARYSHAPPHQWHAALRNAREMVRAPSPNDPQEYYSPRTNVPVSTYPPLPPSKYHKHPRAGPPLAGSSLGTSARPHTYGACWCGVSHRSP